MEELEQARRVIDLEINELGRLRERIDRSFAEAITLLRETIEASGKLVIVGVGKSGNIGNKLAATFNSTGAPSTTLDCQNALHGDLGLVSPGDCVLALSYSGETAELLNVLPHLLRRGVKLLALTGRPESTLGRAADLVLDVSVEREACPLNLAPTSSTTASLVMGDALAMVLLESRGFTRENFAEFHPGGALGQALLLRATDIMRAGNDLVCVPPDTAVSEVLAGMSRARAGAVVVVGGQEELIGIFTQGDFARSFQENDGAIGSLPVEEVMTRNPIHVAAEKLVGEVLRILEEHRIDDLVVVDDRNRPIGMIDTQDLTRMQVV